MTYTDPTIRWIRNRNKQGKKEGTTAKLYQNFRLRQVSKVHTQQITLSTSQFTIRT